MHFKLKKNIFDFFSKNISLCGIIIISAYYIPYLIFGGDSFITIHDNLDSGIANIKTLLDTKSLFNYSKTLPIMDGLPRSSFESPFNLKFIFFIYFSPFTAILINDYLVRIISFIGMFLLLNNYILKYKSNKNFISFIAAICFAFIPFYSNLGISSAGQPLLLWAFLNLKNQIHKKISYLAIFLFGIYSSFVLSGVFICFLLGIYFLFLFCVKKEFYRYLFWGLVLLLTIYIITNITLIYSFIITSDIISHRQEMKSVLSFYSICKRTFNLFVITQYHSGALFTPPIFLSFLYSWYCEKQISKGSTVILKCIGLIILFFFIFQIARIFFSDIEIFNSFQFDRFYFLLPTLWIILYASSIEKIYTYSKNKKHGSYIGIFTSILLIISSLCLNPESRYIFRRAFKIETSLPSFNQFYDTSLFSQISQFIGKPKDSYKIISLGIYPSVSQYNGFYTIDAYLPVYPLDYKHRFRKIIYKELEKNQILKSDFDNWGSRCYLFSSELSGLSQYGKKSQIKVKNLEIDSASLKELGCYYIFSAVEILNYKDLGLIFEQSFTTEKSYWEIFLYKVQ